ncbi:MAG: SMC-Scp complex subunit ScpB [Clostridia bacterium]|nr:SMC-Scp complex subunit ScpB [Clostridia bacterium]
MKILETLASIIESILFISGKEVAVRDIAEKLEITNKEVLSAAKKLQNKYGDDSGINLIIFNNKLQFCSNPKNGESVEVVLNPIKERELSKSMLEVSAIVAYKQPVTRLDIEEIRGVNSEYAIQNLLKNGIIEIVGRKDTIGKPVLFGTGDNFLKRFQIESLTDLPDYNDLMAKIKLIHASDDDSYLFRKDEYDAENDPEYAPENLFGEENEDLSSNVEIPSMDKEEVPDFLKDEEFDVIA